MPTYNRAWLVHLTRIPDFLSHGPPLYAEPATVPVGLAN